MDEFNIPSRDVWINVKFLFGEGSDVTDDLIGVEKSNLVVGKYDHMLLLAKIMSGLAQGCDIEITHFRE